MTKNVFVFYLFLIVLVFAISGSCFAKNKNTFITGILFVEDSTKKDSVLVRSDVDTIVVAEAKDSTINDVSKKTITYYGNAKIVFREWSVEADVIELDWDKSLLRAYNRTLEGDTVKKKLPTLIDRTETYMGKEVAYNFKTKTGVVKYGETKIDDGFYKGEVLKKVSDDCYYIKDGIYTTCDNEHPHFHFGSPKMKVIPKSSIIAAPVYFYIDDLPIFAIPFAVIPNKGGRQSGIVPPAYGDDRRRGKNLRHLGYYWAISDYFDINFLSDIYMKGGYTLSSQFRYNFRYMMNGSLDLSYGKQKFDVDNEPTKDWKVQLNHNHDINPTTNLHVDFTFASSDYYSNTSNNLNELLQLQQNMISNATFNKSWEGTNRSLSINIYRDENLLTGNVLDILPSLTFSQSQIYPFRKSNSINSSWYEDIGFNYSSQLVNRRTKVQNDKFLLADEHNEFRNGINHNVTFNISPKLGHFNLSPSFNYNELWYSRMFKIENVTTSTNQDSIVSKHETGFFPVRTFNMGVGLGTRFYGIFNPNSIGIKSIRHTVNPSISYNFRPDFSTPFFGYYGTYTENGTEKKYSKFEEGVFGAPSIGQNQNVSFNIGNIFEMKTIQPDTVETDNKIQLLNLNASVAYNFAADSMKFSDLNINYRTNIANIFDLYTTTSYSFYDYDTTGRAINKFLPGSVPLRLTRVGINLSASFSGDRKSSSNNVNSAIKGDTDRNAEDNHEDIPVTSDNGEIDFYIPWNLSLSYDYNLSKTNPYYISRISNLRFNFGFSLTEKWRIDCSSYYDLIAKEFLTPQINISRDLHCWVMNFSWVPTGKYAMFNFEIRIKAPQLSDLKLAKQGSARGVFN